MLVLERSVARGRLLAILVATIGQPESSEGVDRAAHREAAAAEDAGVDHRCLGLAVPHQFPDRPDGASRRGARRAYRR